MIKVIIERTIALGLEPNYKEAVRDTLRAVLDAPGYISSESLNNVSKKKHKVIITRWVSLSAWDAWHASDERKMAISSISPLLEEPEKITVLEAG
jgi:antibiotic biosynthesis monooxygenase (ABM) superfamily enzyme